jgi:hypothetical protein
VDEGAPKACNLRISDRSWHTHVAVSSMKNDCPLQRASPSFYSLEATLKFRFLSISLLLAAITLTAAPSTTDLWDSSQTGFSGPILLNGNGTFCGTAINILGGSGNTGCSATFSDSFDALGFDDLSIRWNTTSVTVGSFALYSPSNFRGGELNEIVGIRLYTLDANNQNPVLFYDSGVISHTPANDGTSPLLQVTLNTPVTSANWRLDIIDQPSADGGPIYRIIELDAFASPEGAVPEPSTIALAAIGITALFLRRIRRA